MIQTETRNADLQDLAALLKAQHASKIDAVVPATALRSRNGMLVVQGTEPQLTEDGVTMTAGEYRPSSIFDEGVSDKLGIPLKYLRTLRAERPDLYDANVNGWLHGKSIRRAEGTDVVAEADKRSFLFRGFRDDEGGEGYARALLSDSYGITDNLDVLVAAMDGVKQSGLNVVVEGCDLSERRMAVRISAPAVATLAPVLLADYRSPFRDAAVERVNNHGWDLDRAREAAKREGMGYDPGSEPVVWAGFVLTNSEVGDGAFTLTPRITVGPCLNGLQITMDAIRSVHLGGKMEQGIIRWAEDTQRAALQVVTKKARDAVATFLDADYLHRTVQRLEAKAGAPVAEAERTIEVLGKQLKYTDEQIGGVLDHFIRGGQMTSGGVLNAVTSYCQTVGSVDDAHTLEATAVKAMELAFAAAK